jgi:hypothetical protein
MELVGCEIETEEMAVDNHPTIGQRAATNLIDYMDYLKKNTWLARDMQKRLGEASSVTCWLKAHDSDFLYAGIKT